MLIQVEAAKANLECKNITNGFSTAMSFKEQHTDFIKNQTMTWFWFIGVTALKNGL